MSVSLVLVSTALTFGLFAWGITIYRRCKWKWNCAKNIANEHWSYVRRERDSGTVCGIPSSLKRLVQFRKRYQSHSTVVIFARRHSLSFSNEMLIEGMECYIELYIQQMNIRQRSESVKCEVECDNLRFARTSSKSSIYAQGSCRVPPLVRPTSPSVIEPSRHVR